jgi:hypothetical protein
MTLPRRGMRATRGRHESNLSGSRTSSVRSPASIRFDSAVTRGTASIRRSVPLGSRALQSIRTAPRSAIDAEPSGTDLCRIDSASECELRHPRNDVYRDRGQCLGADDATRNDTDLPRRRSLPDDVVVDVRMSPGSAIVAPRRIALLGPSGPVDSAEFPLVVRPARGIRSLPNFRIGSSARPGPCAVAPSSRKLDGNNPAP